MFRRPQTRFSENPASTEKKNVKSNEKLHQMPIEEPAAPFHS